MAILNIADAARAVGKARSTMYIYIKNGWLSPTVDPVTGKRGIDTDELLRVFKKLAPVESGSETTEDVEDDALEHAFEAATAARDDMIATLKAELEAAKSREARLLDLLSQAQQLALPAGKEEAPPKQGFWKRLLG